MDNKTPMLVILYGLLELCQINKEEFPGYSIYANLNTIICKRIMANIKQLPNQSSKQYPICLESYIHEFALLRILEASNTPILFICINMNNESTNLIQLAYPPSNYTSNNQTIFTYEQLTETEAMLKYPKYFNIKSDSKQNTFTSPLHTPSSAPSMVPKLHDDNISCILEEQLYLSGSVGAENLSQLLELGITHILNITDMIPNYHENQIDENGKSLFTYMKIAIPDCGTIQLSSFIHDTINFINNAMNSNGKVLVHCFAGKSRSASIIIAYIMQLKRISFNEAFKFVQDRREVIDPNFGFCTQLIEFEKTLNLA
jgi:protein-tyrosine phosphatase